MASGPVIAQGQAPGGWQTGIDKATPLRPSLPSDTRAAPPPAALKGPVPERALPNTTVVPRSGVEAKVSGVPVTLAAQLSEEGQPVEQGMLWRIFRARAGADGKLALVSEHREASPSVRLEPGEYLVNAALGRANLTRRIAVQAGKPATEQFVLNAGGLRVAVALANGEAAPEKAVAIDVYSDERDPLGQRIKVLGGLKPRTVVRLNAGIYQLVSTYGDANAIVRGDVTVEPGKLTETGVTHAAARITLRLAARPGGDALPDVQWAVTTATGEPIKESAGALPSHVIAPGRYAVSARHEGRQFRREFVVKAGDNVEVEVVAQ